MSYMMVKGVSKLLDGLVVDVDDGSTAVLEVNQDWDGDLLMINKIIDRNAIVGDRVASMPLPPHVLWINERFLVECEDPTRRQYDSSNPHGNLLYEGRYKKNSLEVAYAQFERCLQVTLMETIEEDGKYGRPGRVYTKTLWTGYFGARDREFDSQSAARRLIEHHFSADADPEDLIFALKALYPEEV